MKSLSEEREKNYSCSNTSKNVVRYIAIKNDFCSFPEGRPSSFRPPILTAESGAKVKPFFETTKSFRKIFQKNFQNLISSSRNPAGFVSDENRLRRSGCKGKSNFRNSKRIRNFFQNFFRTFPQAEHEPFFLRSGCKDTGFGMLFPNISRTFLRHFRAAFHTALKVRKLFVEIF